MKVISKNRLKHAHNLLLWKRLNHKYFDINKNISKKEIFNISPDDFVFEDKSKTKRDKAKALFLKKYLKMKEIKKLQKVKLKKQKKKNIYYSWILEEQNSYKNKNLPNIAYFSENLTHHTINSLTTKHSYQIQHYKNRNSIYKNPTQRN